MPPTTSLHSAPLIPYDIMDNRLLVLDTETTGISDDDQVISVTVTDMETGVKVFDSFIKPTVPIHPKALELHGITEEFLSTAPSFEDVYPLLSHILDNSEVVAYNAEFDKRLLEDTCYDFGLSPFYGVTWQCLMLDYAALFGEFKEHGKDTESPKWQRLSIAAEQQGVDISNIDLHSSSGDCELTRRLFMALRDTCDGQTFDHFTVPDYWQYG